MLGMVGILNHAVTLYSLYQNCIFNFMIIINKTEKAAFFFHFLIHFNEPQTTLQPFNFYFQHLPSSSLVHLVPFLITFSAL